ncbi:MAG: hypothetical protein KA527_02730 [Cytophagaceae bacterium]|nr:hypothetical protein [Cytophagaceae bacterium]MBP6093529.1 hypothetical protein [Cytophagaceae bacterium]
MLISRIYFFLLASFLFVACKPSVEESAKPVFYPWEKYLTAQIDSLAKHPEAVHKTILLAGKKEEKRLKEMDWKQEWAMFLHADLNKPAAATSYDNLSEDGFVWYSLKANESLPVKKLYIQLDALDRPAKVEIEIEEKNFLFETHKKLHMNFADGRVQTYSIEGSQQMRWMSPTHYALMGVLLPK